MENSQREIKKKHERTSGDGGFSLHPSTLVFVYVSSTEPGEPPCITSAGFQFLLLDTPAQLWYFMLQYLQTAQVRRPGMLCSSQDP